MIRSMMFSMEDNDIHSLFDSRPEMNLMVPCTSLLCIVMIIFTAKMLHKLIVESNQKIEISIYQEWIREMEQHIGDIENLYAGIRGMKHDMKNYIADMEALMQEETGNPTAFPAVSGFPAGIRGTAGYEIQYRQSGDRCHYAKICAAGKKL